MILTAPNAKLTSNHVAAVPDAVCVVHGLLEIACYPDLPADSSHKIPRPGVETITGYKSLPNAAAQHLPLDDLAMLELHEWLNRWRFRLFGVLRPCDLQDAIEDTFLQTLEFAPKMRDRNALRSASITIGLRIRAKRIQEYIRERQGGQPNVEPAASWSPERHLHERFRKKRALAAIRGLRSREREILQRFYFDGQSAKQIRDEMQLTETQFRLQKSRALYKAALRTQPAPTRVTTVLRSPEFALQNTTDSEQNIVELRAATLSSGSGTGA